jgi:hypothetical protein
MHHLDRLMRICKTLNYVTAWSGQVRRSTGAETLFKDISFEVRSLPYLE